MRLAKRKREKGFTLIELMVVVLIIAILVSIAIPVYNASRTTARNRTCEANLRTMDGAIETYLADTDGYPTTLALLAPNYIERVPVCPFNGNNDCYYRTAGNISSCSVAGGETTGADGLATACAGDETLAGCLYR